MYVDNIKSPLKFDLKQPQYYSDDEMLELELAFGHDFYWSVKKERDFHLRKKKINKILNRQ